MCVEDTVRYTLLVEVTSFLQELKDATYLKSNIRISRQELCRVFEKCRQNVQSFKSWRLVLQNSHIKLKCKREIVYKFPADESFICDKDFSTAAMLKEVI